MKQIYSRQEAELKIAQLKEDFDLVRLVSPSERQVINVTDMEPEGESCHSVWDRCTRCENCTSLRALTSESNAYKIEFRGEKAFLIISRYMRIDQKPYVLEMVSDISNEFLTDAELKSDMSEMILNYNEKLITDSLTGLFNRRFLDESFIPSLDCCRDRKIPVSIAFMDIDQFKKVNDSYGHIAGDLLLKDVAGYWKSRFNSRQKDADQLAVRYGGDEILLISCGSNLDEFRKRVRGFYDSMRKICYYDGNRGLAFSICFGFASSAEIGEKWEWDELLDLADKRMYAEKMRMRNQSFR